MKIETFKDCVTVCNNIKVCPNGDHVEISGYMGRSTNGGFNSCEFTTRAKDYDKAEAQLIKLVQNLVNATDMKQND